MYKYAIFLLVFFIGACTTPKPQHTNESKKKFPSHIYKYSNIDTLLLNYFETDYAFVYSDIYHRDGTRRYPLTNTISIRNISLQDSAYILSARYFDSYGTMLHNYLDSTILMSPLESIEFVVEETENKGGAGANFIIEWGAIRNSSQIAIQSVMIGTYSQQGISFLTDAKIINQRYRNK